jgi:hypothetical protein
LHESHRRTLWTAAATSLTIQQLITPGAGTTILIGLSGQFCAPTDNGKTLHIKAAAIRIERRLFFWIV